MTVSIIDADLTRADHAEGLIAVLNEYSQLPVISPKPLAEDVQQRLPGLLAANPNAHVLLAMSDDSVAGVAVCFLGFSTFSAMPLLNIHDLAVRGEFQGTGVGGALLDSVAEKARTLGCCRVTLEVDQENPGARRLYERKGFELAQLFMKKLL
jgi:GNAT superfamily N-acetyltransferase